MYMIICVCVCILSRSFYEFFLLSDPKKEIYPLMWCLPQEFLVFVASRNAFFRTKMTHRERPGQRCKNVIWST